MNTIKKIVLTGGPCAGKTTALVKIIDHFSGLGYKVFTIPEVPTMFTQAGMNYLTKNEKFFFEGEKATFLTQIGLEDSFTKMAETIDKPVIIVCDRGTMDISTYLTEDFGTASSPSRDIPTPSCVNATMPYCIRFLPQMALNNSTPQPTTPSAWKRRTKRDCR